LRQAHLGRLRPAHRAGPGRGPGGGALPGPCGRRAHKGVLRTAAGALRQASLAATPCELGKVRAATAILVETAAMDRSIRDGIFATLPGIEGAESSLLAFEQGQLVLHLDLSPLNSAQLLQQRRIEGYTRNVARFTATLNGSFTTNGRFTCALDDLLVEVPWDEDRGGFDRDVVHSAFVFFDPRAVDQFFFQESQALGTAVDGEVISLDNADLAHKYTPAHAKNLAISLTTRSALYGPAADVLSRSNYGRVCLRMDFTEPTDLDTARRKIAAVQSLIEAIGKPGPHYLRELSVLSSEPGTEGLSI